MKTLPELLATLVSLEEEESAITESLSSILSETKPIHNSLRELQALASPLHEIQGDSLLLKSNVSQVAGTARRVGGRVRQLDEEMKRVKEASDRVAQVVELKTAISDIQESIDAQDWEAATRLCARVMALPKDVVEGPFASFAVPTESSPFTPASSLQAFRERLRDVFLQQFEKATEARDSNMVTRFFKLFPPIGWEAEGLEIYSSFVVSLVQPRSSLTEKSSSPLYYVTALTALFESICGIVDQHQPVVEKYYGEGKMLTVVGRLVKECDRTVKHLIANWENDRTIEKTVLACDTRALAAVKKAGASAAATDELQIQPREIDKMLNEISAIIMRVTAYRRFLYANLHHPESEHSASTLSVVENSETIAIARGLIEKYYVPFEEWYLRCTIYEAHRTSATDETQNPPTTTVPDLVFYILRTIFARLTNAGSLLALEMVTKIIRNALEKDYLSVIKNKLEDVYRVMPPSSSANRSEKLETSSRRTFIILLNDLDVSSTHVERLVKEFSARAHIAPNFMEEEAEAAIEHVVAVGKVSVKLRSTLRTGVDQLFNQLVRPKLRNFVPEIYKDVSYILDEESYSVSSNENIVQKRFLKAWQALMDGFNDNFTESNFKLFLDLVIDVIVRPWEKYIVTLKYSELGAIQFDHDIRAITTYLSSQIALGSVRDKFQRLQQIGTLLNVDKDESIDDFFNSSGIAWRLSLADARAVGDLRV